MQAARPYCLGQRAALRHVVSRVPIKRVCSASHARNTPALCRQRHIQLDAPGVQSPQFGHGKRVHVRGHKRPLIPGSCICQANASDGDGQSSAEGNGSIISVAERSSVKTNGSSVVPAVDDGAGSGDGNGGSGDGYGGGGDSSSNGPDIPIKALLLLLSLVVVAAAVYGIYHFWSAVKELIAGRDIQNITVVGQR